MHPMVKKAMCMFDIEWYPVIDVDGAGDKTYAEQPTLIKAYQSGTVKLIRNLSGEEEVSTMQLYISGTSGIKLGDRIKLPDNGGTYPVIKIQSLRGPAGTFKYEVVYLP